MYSKILAGLFFCHFLADYTPLTTSWMLQAKKFGKPLFPIFIHALVHSVLMGLFLLCIGINYIFPLMAIQLTTHLFIDVMKGRLSGWFPALLQTENKWFWIVFGADQFMHALVIILMTNYAIKGF